MDLLFDREFFNRNKHLIRIENLLIRITDKMFVYKCNFFLHNILWRNSVFERQYFVYLLWTFPSKFMKVFHRLDWFEKITNAFGKHFFMNSPFFITSWLEFYLQNICIYHMQLQFFFRYLLDFFTKTLTLSAYFCLINLVVSKSTVFETNAFTFYII